LYTLLIQVFPQKVSKCIWVFQNKFCRNTSEALINLVRVANSWYFIFFFFTKYNLTLYFNFEMNCVCFYY
jgi:hypothetical protein